MTVPFLGLLLSTSVVTSLYPLLGASLAHPMVVATAHLVGDLVAFLANGAGGAFIHRSSIDVAKFVGTVFPEQDVDPIQQMGGTSTECLEVVFPQLHHLGVVDGGNLRIPQPGHLGVEDGSGLDQIGAGLGDTHHHSGD